MLQNRWIDISYYYLVKETMVMIDHIYSSLQKKLTNESRTNMEGWLHKQADFRKNEIRHSYTLDEYGLKTDQVLTSFKPYLDFVKTRGIKIAKEIVLG